MFLEPNRLYRYMDLLPHPKSLSKGEGLEDYFFKALPSGEGWVGLFYNFIYTTLNKALLFLPELIAMCLAIN
jgi:hypothetical protein